MIFSSLRFKVSRIDSTGAILIQRRALTRRMQLNNQSFLSRLAARMKTFYRGRLPPAALPRVTERSLSLYLLSLSVCGTRPFLVIKTLGQREIPHESELDLNC